MRYEQHASFIVPTHITRAIEPQIMNFPTQNDMTGYLMVPSINSQPSQPIATEQFNQTQTSNTLGGLVIIFVLMIYIYLGLCHKRQREKRIAAGQEQIKTLERILMISAHQREI